MLKDIYTNENKKYCVYLTIYIGNKLPMFYIGSSSINKVLTKNYYGSVTSKNYKDIFKQELKENKHLFDVLILSEHDTRRRSSKGRI